MGSKPDRACRCLWDRWSPFHANLANWAKQEIRGVLAGRRRFSPRHFPRSPVHLPAVPRGVGGPENRPLRRSAPLPNERDRLRPGLGQPNSFRQPLCGLFRRTGATAPRLSRKRDNHDAKNQHPLATAVEFSRLGIRALVRLTNGDRPPSATPRLLPPHVAPRLDRIGFATRRIPASRSLQETAHRRHGRVSPPNISTSLVRRADGVPVRVVDERLCKLANRPNG
jgi:hypothetical protein